MQRINTSTFTFSDLIQGDFLYVDKTALVHELVAPSKGQYFLARPRRFGKSLLLSTFKSIFLGERGLFDGLAIAGLDYDWQTYPVIHIDLGSKQARSGTELECLLSYAVDDAAAQYGITLTRQECAPRFQELVERLANDGKVV